MFIEAGVIILTAIISPFRVNHDEVRALHLMLTIGKGDAKGLSSPARIEETKMFTGAVPSYEEPLLKL